jgi:prepilin signal peptidase PulO-like enzyme (type II secretory pathway)
VSLPASTAPFVTAYLVLAALLIGSFINLAADRLPRGESVLHPRSHCRACGRQLNFVDLIPVFGYVIRSGRCATCGTAIGVAAPLVEGISGALMAAAVLLQGLWPGALTGLALVTAWGAVVVIVVWRRGATVDDRQSGRNS